MRNEDIGDPVEDPLSPIGYRRVPIGCHRLAHAPSSMVTMAAFGQMSRTLSPSLNEVPVGRHLSADPQCPRSRR